MHRTLILTLICSVYGERKLENALLAASTGFSSLDQLLSTQNTLSSISSPSKAVLPVPNYVFSPNPAKEPPPVKPALPTADDTFAGWMQIVQIEELKRFYTHSHSANKTMTKGKHAIAFRANRRVDFNSYSHDFIGSQYLTEESYLGEEPYSTRVNTTTYLIAFNSNGFATLQSTANGKYWAYDVDAAKLTWTDNSTDALHLQLFLNGARDVLFFKTVRDTFVSFRGPLHSDISDTVKSKHGLALSSILCENGLFYSPKSRIRDLNAYIMRHRKAALLDYHANISPIFAPYDLALLRLMQKDFTFLQLSTIEHPYEWFNTLFTMTQVIVLNIPEYKKLYPTFGRKLSEDLNLNALLIHTKPEILPELQFGMEKLLSMIGDPIKIEQSNRNQVIWSGLVATLISRAWMRDIDAKRYLLISRRISIHTILQTFYTWSCTLANIMLKDKTTLEKLKHVEILRPLGTIGPYLQKDANNLFWFDIYASFRVSSITQANILTDLGILIHLSRQPIHPASFVGARIAAMFILEATNVLGKNDIQGIRKLLKSEQIVAVLYVSSQICKSSPQLRFCLVEAVFLQFSTILVNSRNEINHKSVTSLMMYQDIRLPEYIHRVLEQSNQKDLMGVINMRATYILQVMEQAVNKTAITVENSKLEAIFSSNIIITKSQKALSKHLELSMRFELAARIAQFNRKINIMTAGIRAANDTKSEMLGSISAIGSRAGYQNLASVLVDTLEMTLSALAVSNPFTAMQMVHFSRFGYLFTDINRLSMSLTTMAFMGALKKVLRKDAAQQLRDTLTHIMEYENVMAKLSLALQPLMDIKTSSLNEAAVYKYGPAFVAAYSAFQPPILDMEVNRVQSIMTEITQAFCTVLDLGAHAGCLTTPALVTRVFENLSQSMLAALDAVDMMFQIASAAINIQHAIQIGKDAMEKDIKNQQATALMKSNWDDNAAKKKVWYEQWKLENHYTNIMGNLGLVMTRSILLQGVIALCNYRAYKSGGFPHAICTETISKERPISDSQIQLLIASKNAESYQEIDVSAFIPTKPAFDGDQAYLDIVKLMNGETQTFQVPSSMEWLNKHQWLSSMDGDLHTMTVFVKQFDLYLLPKYANYQSRKTQISILITFDGVSVLGKAFGNKKVLIPPGRFVNTYEEQPMQIYGACKSVQLPMHMCAPNLPKICSMNGETEPPDFMPSLFSAFKVQLRISEPASRAGDPRIKYSDITSELYLTAMLKLALYTNSGKEEMAVNRKRQGKRKLELRDEEIEEGREGYAQEFGERHHACCAVGYYKDWISGSCRACPRHSVSQMGGFYCVMPLSTSRAQI